MCQAEIKDLTVCIVVNGEKFHTVPLTLIGQCSMSNSSELFSNTTICSSLKWIEPLCLSYCVHRHTHTDRHTDTKTPRHTHTDGYEYSIVAVDKPQL